MHNAGVNAEHAREAMDYGLNDCRRHAPTFTGLLSTSQISPRTGWPLTDAQEWCGDFEYFR